MTAEIAILNCGAVAVAADSAVTIGRRKVHTLANKIFRASDTVPIGVMFWGNADFAGIPWDALVKLFRRESKSNAYSSVEQCADDFFNFLQRPKYLTKTADSLSVGLFASSVADRLCGELNTKTRREISQEIDTVAAELTRRFHGLPTLDTYALPGIQSFRIAYGQLCFDVFSDVCEENLTYKLPKRVRPRISELVYAAMTSAYISDYSSGIAFFGFGDDNIMPSLRAYEIDGLAYQKLRKRIMNSVDINRDKNRATIVPFAEQEIVETFMEGLTSTMRRFYTVLIKNSAEEVAKNIIKENFTLSEGEQKVVEAINKRVVDDLIKTYDDIIKQFVYDNSISEVLSAVRSLPKEDMATLAEALVSVTALKKKVSMGIETVGGEIDVAIVTKGDGLIWVKRKHYFDLDKNMHYLSHRFGDSKLSLARGVVS